MASNILSQSGIYRILNIVTGKCYIGSASVLYKRRNQHLSKLRRSKHENEKLQLSWNEHGELNFSFEILLLCDKENTIMYEQICIDHYDSCNDGYNKAPMAGGNAGMPRSDEWKKKIGLKHKDKILSDEVKAKISKSLTGKVQSEETRKKQSIKRIGNEHPNKSVIRVTDGKWFKSGKDACIAHGAGTYAGISRAIKSGIRAFGHYWKFEGDERTLNDFENEATNRQIGKGSHFNGTQSGRGKSARKVIRLIDGKIFESAIIAAIELGLYKSSIYVGMKRNQNRKGSKWAFV